MPNRVNRRGVARREALINAAIDLWSTTGWRGTGITAVAQRAGVTPAGLLHHFGTKERFLLAVLAEMDRRTLAQFENAPTGLDALRLLPELVRQPGERPGLWKLHLMLQAENFDEGGPAYDYYVGRHRYLHDRFAGIVRDGQQLGEIRADASPDLVATDILAFLLGLQVHRIHGPADIDPVAVCKEYTARLIAALTR